LVLFVFLYTHRHVVLGDQIASSHLVTWRKALHSALSSGPLLKVVGTIESHVDCCHDLAVFVFVLQTYIGNLWTYLFWTLSIHEACPLVLKVVMCCSSLLDPLAMRGTRLPRVIIRILRIKLLLLPLGTRGVKAYSHARLVL
jgi:hypothetical protein